jgi:bacterioferritin-associated ferredoxin
MEVERVAVIRQRMAHIRTELDDCLLDDPPWHLIDEAFNVIDELLIAAQEDAELRQVIAEHAGCNAYDCGDCVGAIQDVLATSESGEDDA